MMSLSKISLPTVVRKQLQYKIKTNIGMFTSLVIVQGIALFFSIVSPMHGLSGMDRVEIEYHQYNIFNVISFTTLWAFIHSIMMTTKKDWENSFPFVGNGISNDISNMVFLAGVSIVAGLLTVLSAFGVRAYTYYFKDEMLLMTTGFELTGNDILAGSIAMIFHLLFINAVGYFLGTVTRLHRLMPALLPVILGGTLIAYGMMNSYLLMDLFEFYYGETNSVMFILKMIVTAAVLFACSLLISKRTEVRK